MPTYLGALDQGTTSTRFILFDRMGRIVAQAQKEHEQIYPESGWVEHNPLEIWHRAVEVIEEACALSGIAAADIASIGITNQRETPSSGIGPPATRSTTPSSGRTPASVHIYRICRPGPTIVSDPGGLRERTGLPLATYFSGLKVRWILDNVPGVRARAEAGDLLFGNIDSFLLWHLTGGKHNGVHRTDVTTASRTQLMNLDTLDWDPELLDLFTLPRAMMPQVCSSSADFGTLAVTCLRGIPVGGVLGDQHAALVGQACFTPGLAKILTAPAAFCS